MNRWLVRNCGLITKLSERPQGGIDRNQNLPSSSLEHLVWLYLASFWEVLRLSSIIGKRLLGLYRMSQDFSG